MIISGMKKCERRIQHYLKIFGLLLLVRRILVRESGNNPESFRIIEEIIVDGKK